MKQYMKRNGLLLGLTAVAAVVSLFVIASRWRVENGNKTYDVVLDYIELEWMVEQSSHDMAWWLNEFKDMGITKVGLTEENLTTLMEDSPLNVTATVMGEIMQDAGWRDNYPEVFVQEVEERGFDRFDVIVEIANTSEFDAIRFLVQAVEERFPAGSYFCMETPDDEASPSGRSCSRPNSCIFPWD